MLFDLTLLSFFWSAVEGEATPGPAPSPADDFSALLESLTPDSTAQQVFPDTPSEPTPATNFEASVSGPLEPNLGSHARATADFTELPLVVQPTAREGRSVVTSGESIPIEPARGTPSGIPADSPPTVPLETAIHPAPPERSVDSLPAEPGSVKAVSHPAPPERSGDSLPAEPGSVKAVSQPAPPERSGAEPGPVKPATPPALPSAEAKIEPAPPHGRPIDSQPAEPGPAKYNSPPVGTTVTPTHHGRSNDSPAPPQPVEPMTPIHPTTEVNAPVSVDATPETVELIPNIDRPARVDQPAPVVVNKDVASLTTRPEAKPSTAQTIETNFARSPLSIPTTDLGSKVVSPPSLPSGSSASFDPSKAVPPDTVSFETDPAIDGKRILGRVPPAQPSATNPHETEPNISMTAARSGVPAMARSMLRGGREMNTTRPRPAIQAGQFHASIDPPADVNPTMQRNVQEVLGRATLVDRGASRWTAAESPQPDLPEVQSIERDFAHPLRKSSDLQTDSPRTPERVSPIPESRISEASPADSNPLPPAAIRAAPPATPVRTELLAQTVLAEARQLPPNTPVELRFALQPEDLGTVRVRILAAGEQLHVKLITDSSAASGALNAGVPRLMHHLQDAGFRDAEVTLTLETSTDSTPQQRHGDRETARDPKPAPTVHQHPALESKNDRREPLAGSALDRMA